MANIVERPIVPHNPSPTRAVQKEQYNLFAPVAANGKVGMAKFNAEQFEIREQEVSFSPKYSNAFEQFMQGVVKIEKVNENGTIYLNITLANGETKKVILNDFVKKVSDSNILYGTDSKGNQIKYYANSYDGDSHIPSKEPWSNIIPTKEFVKARNPTYQHGFTPTVEQYGKKDMKGWYRIAVKTPTASGEGHAGNLFKVHCYVYGAGDCDIVFLVDQAEWNTKYVAISVLSYSYRTAKVITDIRVAYPKKDYKEDTLAYIDVYVDVNPTAKGFDSDRAIMFRTEELFYNSSRSWVPIYPRVVRDFVEGDVVVDGVLVDTDKLPNGKKSNDAYPNYGYHTFYTKSAVDHAWSDVTATTEELNRLPSSVEQIRDDTDRLQSKLSEDIDGVYDQLYALSKQVPSVPTEFAWLDVDRFMYNTQLLFNNAYKYRFDGSIFEHDLSFDFVGSGDPWFIPNYIIFHVIFTPNAALAGEDSVFGSVKYDADCTITSADGYKPNLEIASDIACLSYSLFGDDQELSISFNAHLSWEDPDRNMHSCDGMFRLKRIFHDGSFVDGGCTVEAYVGKTNQTADYFNSTMGLREESLKRQLLVFAEERNARNTEE